MAKKEALTILGNTFFSPWIASECAVSPAAASRAVQNHSLKPMSATIESSESTDAGIYHGLSFLWNAESPKNLQQTDFDFDSILSGLYRWDRLTIFSAILRKDSVLKTMSDEHFAEGNAACEACTVLETSTPAEVTVSPVSKPTPEATTTKDPRGISFATEPFAIRVGAHHVDVTPPQSESEALLIADSSCAGAKLPRVNATVHAKT